MNLHLLDPSNQSDCGSFELKGPVDRVIRYLDGPVRRDTRDHSHHYIDAAIAALREERLDVATPEARAIGIYLTEIIGELPLVIDLGEDSEMWFVSGTTDAHSAEEAVRKHWSETFDNDDADEFFDKYDLGDLGLEFRTDWAWRHPEGWPVDAGPEDDSCLVFGFQDIWLPRFSGYLVKL